MNRMNHLKLYRTIVAKTDRSKSGAYLPLWMHLRDTAAVMTYLVDHWLSESIIAMTGLNRTALLQLAVLLAMVHDIGKISNAFQTRIRRVLRAVEEMLAPLLLSAKEPNNPLQHHTLIGAAALHELGVPAYLSSIVGAHHGKIMNQPRYHRILDEPLNVSWIDAQRQDWRALWQECLDEAMAQAGYASVEEIPAEMTIPAQMLLTALLILADWLASSTAFFPLIAAGEAAADSAYPLRAERGLEQLAEFLTPWEPSDEWRYADIFQERFGYPEPNAVQQAIAQVAEEAEQPGLCILEAPMGMGKTEAALLAGEVLANRAGARGMAFFLPSQATANAMFGRIMDWLHRMRMTAPVWDTVEDACGGGQWSIRLAHGKAAMNDTFAALMRGETPVLYDEEDQERKPQEKERQPETGLATNAFFLGRKTQLMADFVVGTVDQLLMGALPQKHVMLRHLGLAGKVIIVDEVHAYDAYMTRYMTRMLDWLGVYRTPVILLSATLPGQRRAELVGAYLGDQAFAGRDTLAEERAYPLLTWTDGRTVHTRSVALKPSSAVVRIQRGEDGEVISFLRERLRSGGCAGVVVNTVKRAQQLTVQLKQALPEYDIILDHAQMVMPDRIRREEELLRRLGRASGPAQRNGLIVVGTSVLEASLDLDFDVMVTDLCPMDLLLQRLGRLHRHAERSRPEGLQQAVCLVLGTQKLEDGAKAVYGEYLLARTAALLPREIRLPEDIPALVQEAYRPEADALDAQMPGGEQLRDGYLEQINEQQTCADKTCLQCDLRRKGRRKSVRLMDGLMEKASNPTEEQAVASVRDGVASLEVLVMQYDAEGYLHTADECRTLRVSPSAMPSLEEARVIQRQSLRLPQLFTPGNTVDALEHLRQTTLREWCQSPLIGRELFLLLDPQGSATLAGRRVHYDSLYGLRVEQEDEHDGKGV